MPDKEVAAQYTVVVFVDNSARLTCELCGGFCDLPRGALEIRSYVPKSIEEHMKECTRTRPAC